MAKRYCRPEVIIAKFREADTSHYLGQTVAEITKILGINDLTYYPWRNEYRSKTQKREVKQEILVYSVIYGPFRWTG
ncbi:MAG: hypothetical protein P4L42_02095 [Desulfocapsaceae bacterium]|nr:hypothetical protein [Desulfocapsaceae bacterium]